LPAWEEEGKYNLETDIQDSDSLRSPHRAVATSSHNPPPFDPQRKQAHQVAGKSGGVDWNHLGERASRKMMLNVFLNKLFLGETMLPRSVLLFLSLEVNVSLGILNVTLV
jgi:hypothetical protein